MPLVLHTEVRTKFSSLWSFNQAEGFFVVKVSEERRKELEADESFEQLTEKLVESMLGFTKVLRHLSSAWTTYLASWVASLSRNRKMLFRPEL